MAIDDAVIDARGLKCPLPVLKMEKRLANAAAGTVVTVLATDPMAKIDIPLFCRQHDHAVTQKETDGVICFEVTALGAPRT
ncbi:Sulfurtransferase TusA [compost metagenome]